MKSVHTRSSSVRAGIALSSLALALALPSVARAQGAPADEGKPDDEIVVTGTLIRSVVPAGAQSISVSQQTIESTGATSTDQLLATIPQLNSFGNLQTVNAGGTQLTVNRINLRNLPQGIGGSSPTLVLLDGHRMVGAGVKQSYPDPDVIPPALIQRVEILTDGGSAVYGSDAVGGVVNFVTRRDFDGFEVGIRGGVGDSFKSIDVNFTAGRTWATGGAYVGYNYAMHDAVFGSERDFVRNWDYVNNRPADRSCNPANVVQGGQTYAVVGGNSLVLSNSNLCDSSDVATLYPREVRHSVMAGFRQELSDSVEFEVKGYYSQRNNRGEASLRTSINVTSATPTYISTGGGSTANQTVFFNFDRVGGKQITTTRLWSWGITPTITWKFGNDWRLKAYFNYGESETTANDQQFNSTALNSAVAAGTINPYNIAASNPTALGTVLNWTNYGIGKASMTNAKVTVDGPLFKLPGGEVRVALGGEFLHETFAGFTRTDTYQVVATTPLVGASRNVKSLFGELNIPLIGPDNNFPLVNSLVVSAALRYDDYSDFGHNWAPMVGATLKPVDWISLRGRWNKSFQAPSLVQISQASSPIAAVNPAFVVSFAPMLVNPAVPFNNGPIVSIQGSVSPLQPQRARDYNLGFDISPPFVPGLNLHFTYFNIDYRGSISTPPLGFGRFYDVPTFQPLYIMLPTIAQIQNFMTAAGVPAASIANVVSQVNAQGGNAYVVADVRARNLGISKVNGYDFGFEYRRDVSFGSIDATFSASYTNFTTSAADGVNFLPNQAGIDGTRFNFVARVGADVGDRFRAQLTWNHLAGFNLSVPAQLNQRKVDAFNTFDLFMKYEMDQGSLPPITWSLGINNMFDQRPPQYNGAAAGTAGGYWNGSTIGRVFNLGASVKF